MRLLIVDDSMDDRELIVRALSADGIWSGEILECSLGSDALETLKSQQVDCMLIDFSMPGDDGVTILREVHLRYPDLPIVMVTGEGNEAVAVAAFRGGACDYVRKEALTSEALRAAIETACRMKAEESELLRRANYDELTGLPNRRMFEDRLRQALQQADRADAAVALALLDLDGFKAVNDIHGHTIGDRLLQEVAARLRGCLDAGDFVARLGGDEFVLLISCAVSTTSTVIDRTKTRLTRAIDDKPIIVDGQPLDVGISSGFCLFPQMASTRSQMLSLADRAMYADKAARRANRETLG